VDLALPLVLDSSTRNGLFLNMFTIAQLAGKTVAVVGAGVTGASVIDFLLSRNAKVQLFDERQLELSGFTARQGFRPDDDFDLAVISPGWRTDHPLILAFRDRGVSILSELDLAWLIKEEIAPDQKWVALTGTNGKTTTIQMLDAIFRAAGVRGKCCGNVGEPVIGVMSQSEVPDVLALELSSFQIEWSDLPKYVAVAILNIAEDHIDWHGSFDSYANAKLKLLSQSASAILNLDDPEVAIRTTAWNGAKVFYSLGTPNPGELGLTEELLIDRAFSAQPTHAEVIAELTDIQPTVPHNVSNALAAAGLALSLNISHEDIREGLRSFRPDHHRLELIATFNEISFIDDSKATNPHATVASVLSFLSVIWIAGGLAKGASMDSLVRRAAPRVKAAILIGEDRELIADALGKYAPQIPIYRVDKTGDVLTFMQEIVRKAIEIAEPGDTVLLAPACASMDQFSNYAERGNAFAEAVKGMAP
jgi:UDP-N-acetylmuramoylalanine--D-glutamate ligase